MVVPATLRDVPSGFADDLERPLQRELLAAVGKEGIEHQEAPDQFGPDGATERPKESAAAPRRRSNVTIDAAPA